MSYDEIVSALVAKGVSRERAEVVAHANIGPTLSNAIKAAPAPKMVELPVRITLPWSALCSDNERKRPTITMVGDTPSPRQAMSARYKAAREKIITAARRAMGDADPLDVPLLLVAMVYVPTQRRVDVSNFSKGVQDELNKIVYTDDHLLHDVRWVKAGTDMDAPRVELEIRPL